MDNIRIEHDIEMVTRDGVTLRADVLRPDTRGQHPALVMRTPYNKQESWLPLMSPLRAARSGYAVVLQDVRGRFASDGEWDAVAFADTECDDGYDTVEWVAEQSWCDGNVGMFGHSYEALVQFSAARAQPPSLRAIAPSGGGAGPLIVKLTPLFVEYILVGWAAGMAIDLVTRGMQTGEAGTEHMQLAMAMLQDPVSACWTLPMNDLPVFSIPGMPDYWDFARRLARGAEALGNESHRRVQVPALVVGGLYDIGVGSDAFRGLREFGATEVCRTGTKTILGPWSHGPFTHDLGERAHGFFADAAGAQVAAAYLSFFDRHVKGMDVAELPNVRYFLLGANAWKEAEDWPVPGTEYRDLFFHSDGKAQTARGNGTLSSEPPGGGQQPDRYTYDPMNPVPSFGIRMASTGISSVPGPLDQARIESREDVLVYTSEPLETPLAVVGDAEARLFVATSALDTDFFVKLCDVDEQGRSFNISDGMIRGRYRDSFENPQPLVPGEVYELTISLNVTANLFKSGHRLRVQISSSAFPYWDRNMNTGNPMGQDAAGKPAQQTVFHSSEFPSRLRIPVVPVSG